MLLKEYFTHHVIGTPLEGIAYKLRGLTHWQKRANHSDFQELSLESSRIELAMAHIINSSMNCIDVGAHLGSVLSLIKRLSPHGHHFAIEPVPYKYKWLRQKFPDVEVLQLALSSMVGEVDFFLQPHYSGFSGLRFHDAGDPTRKIEILKVQCQRLDDIIPANLPIGFIKVDVEGGELAVLQGSESILQRYQPTILFECTQSGLDAHTFTPNDVYTFFDDHSYAIFLVKDWLETGKALSYEQFVRAMQYPFQAFNFLAIAQT